MAVVDLSKRLERRMNSRPQTIAEKLDMLFKSVHPRSQGEYSYNAVAEGIGKLGVSISHTYLWQLRTGRRDNPTITHLSAIAKFFGVPTSYFLDEAEAENIGEELQLLAALRAANVTDIALRAADLSPGSRKTITDMMQKVWELEQGPEKSSP
jgi:transcriptional regulator with XRE-family HTH domain